RFFGKNLVSSARSSGFAEHVLPGQLRLDWSAYGRVILDDGVQVLLRAAPQDVQRLAEAGAELRALTLEPKPLRLAPSTRTFPAVITPDPLIQSMISQVESTIVYSYTGDLTGEWPVEIGGLPYTITTRYTDSGQPLQKATQFVGEHLADLGLNVEYHTWDASYPPNVIGELPGVLYPDEIVIICAHLDDLPDGLTAPGADDNASGSVGVLVAADILTQYQWAYTLRFALWTGEEQGLLGSDAYAQRAYNSGENIVGVLNLDMIGWNTPSSSPDIDLHADSTIPSTLDLANLFADVVDAYGLSLVPEIVPNGTGASDHASFWKYGYTAILGIEDFSDFNPYYHTTNDLLAYLNMPYYTDLVKAAVGTFAYMGYPLGSIGYLSGTVSSIATGDPISGAAVAATLPPTMTWSTTTGAGGVYQLKVISGTYTVTVAAPGYVSAITTGITVQTDQTSTLDVALAVTGPCTPVSGVDFDYDPLEPLAGDEVVFAGSAMEGTAELPITYTWDFGDENGVGEGNPITHTFPLTITTQTYTVTLTVANGCPSQRVAWKTVTVQAGAKVYLPFVVRDYR
ncbi:MAG: M28 family peptidase, partial [Anaerolineae bacterium]